MRDLHPKLVDTFHYHLWTDALHLRAIAHQARNRWDRGTYVRCTVIVAWTALESACNDALSVRDIGYRFRENLDLAIEHKSLQKLDWSQGLWQEVTRLQERRREFVHLGISDTGRFAEAGLADQSIDVCRRAIKAIYSNAGKIAPNWVDDDTDPGFDRNRRPSPVTLIKSGVDSNHPDTIRIVYVYKDEEFESECHPKDTDFRPLLDDLIQKINLPITAVRAYRGKELLEARELLMRGN